MDHDVLEYQVLSTIRDRIEFKKALAVLKEELFETRQTRHVYKVIRQHHTDKKSPNLTIASLTALVLSSIKTEEKATYKKLLLKIKRHALKDKDVTETLIQRFAKRQIIKHTINELLDGLEAGEEADFERVQQRITQAIGVNQASVGESYDYFKDPYRRIKLESSEKRIATKFSPEFDEAIGGGLAAGEIGILIGPTGIGKTLCLVNLGYGAMLQGKKVIHATLEIRPRKVARRYDIRVAGRPFSEIRSDPGLVQKKLRALHTYGAGLRIKDYTSYSCSTSDIRAYLETVRENFRFDLIIVDHADLMYSTRQYKEKRMELSNIIATLRQLANEFSVPIWTASQANRAALEKGRTALHNIAEDIGKANWSDVAVTISQDEEEKEAGLMHLKIAKNRIEKGNPSIKVNVDYDIMKIWGREKKMKELRRKLRDG